MSQYPETERLLKVMSDQQLNARNFAEQVGIQPATMSNLASGRNRPSLEVLQKVLNTFRMISSDWLILGSGPMYRQKGAAEATSAASASTVYPATAAAPESSADQPELLFDVPASTEPYIDEKAAQVASATHTAPASRVAASRQPSAQHASQLSAQLSASRQIQRIVVFYTDGTFDELGK